MDTQALLVSAANALKTGNKALAREQLTQVVETDENNEQAWLWLAGAVEDPAEMRICLENVLHLNPNNQRAQQGLKWLQSKNPEVFNDTPTALPAPEPIPTTSYQATPSITPATGATISLDDLAKTDHSLSNYPDTTNQPSYHVPTADGRNLAHAANQPCPKCGEPTKFSDKRCKACGTSLMISVHRADANPYFARIAGLLSMIYAILDTLLVIAAMLLVGFVWTFVKRELLSTLPPAQQKNVPPHIQAQLDQAYKQGIEPIFIILGILLLICILWIFISRGVRRGSKVAYIANWFFVLPIGIAQALALVRFMQQREEISFVMRQAPPFMQNFITGYLFGFAIGTVYVGAMVVFMVLAWKNFFRTSTRLVVDDQATTNANQHFNRGVRYNREGYTYQAMVEWERAVQANPKDAMFRHALGVAYATMKRPADALQELNQAVELAPDDEKILLDRDRVARSVK